MKTDFRLAALCALLPVLALGAWRLNPQSPKDVHPCRNPVGVMLEQRVIAVCLGQSNEASLDHVLAQAGVDHRCPVRGERVQTGQMVLLSEDCDVSVEPLPARLAMTLGLRVDLNRADEEELQALPRIGPKKARWIVMDRKERGPYSRLEDLKRVKGIGPRTVEHLRPLVKLGLRNEEF